MGHTDRDLLMVLSLLYLSVCLVFSLSCVVRKDRSPQSGPKRNEAPPSPLELSPHTDTPYTPHTHTHTIVIHPSDFRITTFQRSSDNSCLDFPLSLTLSLSFLPYLGDFSRHYDTMVHGSSSSVFSWLNRGKESLVLDLKVRPSGVIRARTRLPRITIQ
jgi:hypothetical protein